MAMILKPVEFSEAEPIFPLVEERIAETHLGPRLDFGLAKAMILTNLMQKTVEVFTDDKEKPNCVLIVNYGRLTVMPEMCAIMSVMHVSKAFREKDPNAAIHLGREMLKLAEVQARSKGCDVLRGSSLVWRGGLDISSFYESSGFEIQSKEYVKLLQANQP
jgi:hypothetical protein